MATARLGTRQGNVLAMLADHGYWSPGCGWAYGTSGQMRAVLRTLVARGLVWQQGDRWYLNNAGYAALIERSAADLAFAPDHCAAAALVAIRISHLGTLAKLAQDAPVNWRGERVDHRR
jgi:hypothetical protein